MFAYNEQDNIEASITSIFNNVNAQLNCFYLIANGCSDDTVAIANRVKEKLGFSRLNVVEIELGDKCNAWNTYLHELADDVDAAGPGSRLPHRDGAQGRLTPSLPLITSARHHCHKR